MNFDIETNCPYCNETVKLTAFTDHNYGADADGNRGRSMTFFDIVEQDCDCDLSDWDFEDVDSSEAEEDPRDEYNPEDYYDTE